ncbi:MAG TPA: DUF2283 domain-containing protein [Acetobacteraceae bacterium]|nr:DUF2283 domain-containing protein [Acetobacteraceae bacterium]
MAQTIPTEKFEREFQTGATYVELSTAPVGYTIEITEAGESFLADYDASGKVRGLEFLGGRRHSIDHYRELAQRRSKGPGRSGPGSTVAA